MLFWACWFHVWGPLGEKNKFDRICVDVTQGFVGFKLDLRWEIGVFRSCCWKIDFVSLPCLYADTSRYKHAYGSTEEFNYTSADKMQEKKDKKHKYKIWMKWFYEGWVCLNWIHLSGGLTKFLVVMSRAPTQCPQLSC